MVLKVAIQMDPVESINIEGDSTFVLGLEAQKRGYPLYYYHPSWMFLKDNVLYARTYPLGFKREEGNHYHLGEPNITRLDSMDVILMRQDPPFNMHYINATHLLETIQDTTKIVNNPAGVRNAPEKLFPCQFPDLMPATFIGEDKDSILQFVEEQKEVVIKPIYAHGGKDVFQLNLEDKNLVPIIDMVLRQYECPLIVQQFLPEIAQGDKRIIMIDGEVVGAIRRMPAKGQIRTNMVVGGTPEKTELNDRDKEICETIAPTLKAQGLFLAGLDVIGAHLIEVNVTSPTGLQALNQLEDMQAEVIFWDKLESSDV